MQWGRGSSNSEIVCNEHIFDKSLTTLWMAVIYKMGLMLLFVMANDHKSIRGIFTEVTQSKGARECFPIDFYTTVSFIERGVAPCWTIKKTVGLRHFSNAFQTWKLCPCFILSIGAPVYCVQNDSSIKVKSHWLWLLVTEKYISQLISVTCCCCCFLTSQSLMTIRKLHNFRPGHMMWVSSN